MQQLLIVKNINIVNRQMYTWGKGPFGELGLENCQFSNVPLPINVGDIFVNKVQCGKNFTALIDCKMF
jgi:hypothetical protein